MIKRVFVILAVLGLASSLLARDGAQFALQFRDGREVSGELLAVKDHTLILRESVSFTGVEADVNDLVSIRVERKSKALLGGGLGFVLGGVTGLLAGSALRNSGQNMFNKDPNIISGIIAEETSWAPLVYGVGGALAGGVIGVIIGAAAGADQTISLGERSDTEMKKLMAWLRTKAAYEKESY